MGHFQFAVGCLIWAGTALVGAAAEDLAERQAAALVAGTERFHGISLSIQKENHALVARDTMGMLVEEIFPGTSSKKIEAGRTKVLVGYGKDRRGRLSLLLRVPEKVQEPQTVQLYEFLLVLSPEASITVILEDFRPAEIVPSRIGQVYLLQRREDGRLFSERLTSP